VPEVSENTLGRVHFYTLASMNNLAGVLNSQGQYDEAEAMYRQVLEISENALGWDHFCTLSSMNNLAGMLKCQGRDAEAYQVIKEMKDRQKRIWRDRGRTTFIFDNFIIIIGFYIIYLLSF
jgi:tetratricopeptide (TPR) repeat protein